MGVSFFKPKSVRSVTQPSAEAMPQHKQPLSFVSNGPDHLDNWERYKSATLRYFKRDLITEFLVSQLVRVMRSTTETTISKVAISAMYVVIGISLLLVITGFQSTLLDGKDTIQWILRQILDALSLFGLSKSLAGGDFVIALAASTIAALLSETQISRELRKTSNTYVEKIESTRTTLKDAKQMYLGGGQLRFSYGDRGLFVRGGNLEMYLQWEAAELAMLAIMRNEEVSPVSDIDEATHLLIFLKARNRSDETYGVEFLVVPRRFFNSPIDASTWEDFANNLPIERLY